MTERRPRKKPQGQTVKAAQIRLDPAFGNLIPPPHPEALKHLEHQMVLHGSCEPFLVWNYQGKLILLTDYERFALARRLCVPIRVLEQTLPCYEAAKFFVAHHELAQRNLSAMAISNLRGQLYLCNKLSHGGDRRSPETQAGTAKTIEAVAEKLFVSVPTLRRDGRLAYSVNRIAEIYGDDARALLLARGAKVTQDRILEMGKLADTNPVKVRNDLMELRLTGQLPRQALEGTGKTITLPWEPEDFVRKLLKTRGREHYQEVRLWINLVAEEQGIAG